MDRLAQDIRYALRMMRRTPGFTAVAILSLALGIGANTAIFSLIDTLMLRPLPVGEPGRLVEILGRYRETRGNQIAWKYYEHFRDGNHVFSDLLATAPARFRLAGDRLDPEVADGEYVAGNYFSALGLRPAAGRLLGPDDDRLGAPTSAVAVVSWPYWKKRFNLDPTALGAQITINEAPMTIVGVAPREFFGLQIGIQTDVWIPASHEPVIQPPGQRGTGALQVKMIGRLKPGASIEAALAELQILDRPVRDDLAKTKNAPFLRDFRLEVEPAAAGFSTLRDQFRGALTGLMAAVGLLLLIACTNVASLLLARAAARQQELAVRVSLGASRLRLVRQALTESLLLSGAGGALGAGFAYAGARVLARMMGSGRGFVGIGLRQLQIDVVPDARVLLFTAAVASLTGVLFGLAPAWIAFASAPASSLRATGRFGDTRSRRLFGRGLVIAQVALSVVLLSGAALFTRHLSNLRNVDLGFERQSVLLVTIDPSHAGYERNQLASLFDQLLERMQAIPGVRSATLSAVTPIEGPGAARMVNVEGFQEKPDDRRFIPLNWVAPRYFETFGTPVLGGRDFRREDESGPRVAIVNDAFARYYFAGESPIGRHFTFDGIDRVYEIVGVVGTAKYQDLTETPPRTIYLNALQEGRGTWQKFALRTAVPPASIAGDVRRTVRDTLKGLPIAKVTTLTEQVDSSIVAERMIALLSGVFAALGLLLAAIGLYGLLAYTVARRTNEIGIRMALGATTGDVTRMVLRGAMGLVCAGLAIGAPLAVWSRQLAAHMVPRLPAGIAAPIALASVVMIGMALAASWVPVRRATRVDPAVALRRE
jgi:predicted permease